MSVLKDNDGNRIGTQDEFGNVTFDPLYEKHLEGQCPTCGGDRDHPEERWHGEPERPDVCPDPFHGDASTPPLSHPQSQDGTASENQRADSVSHEGIER